MIRSILTKTIYDKRFFILGWSLSLMITAMLMVAFFPAMRPGEGMDAMLANMPDAFKGLVGSMSDLAHFDTYLASQLFDIRLPLMAGIMAIILGLGISTREEEDGELRTLLGLPISRTRIFVEKWLAMDIIILITLSGLVAGVYTMMPFVEDARIEVSDMLALVSVSWLTMVAFGTVTFAAGIATGRRAVASFIGILGIVGSYLISTFAVSVDWLKPYEMFSLLHYFPAIELVKGDFSQMNILVLSCIILVALAVSLLLFRRRDVK